MCGIQREANLIKFFLELVFLAYTYNLVMRKWIRFLTYSKVIIIEKFLLSGPDHDKIVACYYTNWAVYRPGAGSFDIFDIEPSLCSHLIYSFMGLDENSFKIKSIGMLNIFFLRIVIHAHRAWF